MEVKTEHQLKNLQSLSLQELIDQYKSLFDTEKVPVRNKTFLYRKIAFRIQETAYGGLSQELKTHLSDLIKTKNPIHTMVFKKQIVKTTKKNSSQDQRIPLAGTIITKKYKGQHIEVKVLDKGFEYKEQPYKTLTAVAKEITGAHWNGYKFFNL